MGQTLHPLNPAHPGLATIGKPGTTWDKGSTGVASLLSTSGVAYRR